MGAFSAVLVILAENSSVTGEFPAQRPVTRSFGVFFDLHRNTGLSKQSWGWWFETPSCPLWHHNNVNVAYHDIVCCQNLPTIVPWRYAFQINGHGTCLHSIRCAFPVLSYHVKHKNIKIHHREKYIFAITYATWPFLVGVSVHRITMIW